MEHAGSLLAHPSIARSVDNISEAEDSKDYELTTLLRPDDRSSSSYDLTQHMQDDLNPSSTRYRAAWNDTVNESTTRKFFRKGCRIARRRRVLSIGALLITLVFISFLFLLSVSDVQLSASDYASWLEDYTRTTFQFLEELEDEWEDPTKPHRMKTMETISGECLEAWVARGALCSPSDGLFLMRRSMSLSQLDAVWTWVNGSDPRHKLSRQFWSTQPANSAIYEIEPPDGLSSDVSSSSLPSHPRPNIPADPATLSRIHAANVETLSRLAARGKARRGTDFLANTETGKWFRDHDELKYSMRGVKMHLEGLRTMHVLAGDFERPFRDPTLASSPSRSVPDGNSRVTRLTVAQIRRTDGSDPEGDEEQTREVVGDGSVDYLEIGFTDWIETPDDLSSGGVREGQWPQWIDSTVLFDEEGNEVANTSVRIQHHWNVYDFPNGTDRDSTNWKNRVLPSFDSYAIETQLMNLDELHEIFIYNNDDFFINKDFAVSDFYTPLYGQVFRFQSTSGVAAVENDHSDASGEVPQLHRSAWIIAERFGHRQMDRPYIEHATKTYALPLLKETRLMFPEEFARTSAHRFRGVGQDIVTIFLANHMTVERHREALLWSFLVARGDRDGDGWVDGKEMEELVSFLSEGVVRRGKRQDVLDVMMPRRTTLAGIIPILEAVGMKPPKQTTITYTSQDGYPNFRPEGESQGWPKVYGQSSTTKMCRIEFLKCLPEYFDAGSPTISVDTLMKRWAFEKTDCGDCAIVQLTRLSGSRGMSAFLPYDDIYFPTGKLQRSPLSGSFIPTPVHSDSASPPAPAADWVHVKPPPLAYLPIGSTWKNLTYSLSAIQEMTGWPADRTRREFAMRLIQRYSYVTASSSFYLAMLSKPDQALAELTKITDMQPALVCINDDIVEGRDVIDEALEKWLQRTFPEPLPFERPI